MIAVEQVGWPYELCRHHDIYKAILSGCRIDCAQLRNCTQGQNGMYVDPDTGRRHTGKSDHGADKAAHVVCHSLGGLGSYVFCWCTVHLADESIYCSDIA